MSMLLYGPIILFVQCFPNWCVIANVRLNVEVYVFTTAVRHFPCITQNCATLEQYEVIYAKITNTLEYIMQGFGFPAVFRPFAMQSISHSYKTKIWIAQCFKFSPIEEQYIFRFSLPVMLDKWNSICAFIYLIRGPCSNKHELIKKRW